MSAVRASSGSASSIVERHLNFFIIFCLLWREGPAPGLFLRIRRVDSSTQTVSAAGVEMGARFFGLRALKLRTSSKGKSVSSISEHFLISCGKLFLLFFLVFLTTVSSSEELHSGRAAFMIRGVRLREDA